jgi:hypothetical protein
VFDWPQHLFVALPIIAMFLLFVATLSAEPTPLVDPRFEHFECFSIVSIVERELQGGKSEADITTTLNTHCAGLQDPRQNICTTIVTGQVRRIIDTLNEKKRPGFVCEILGFARGNGGARPVSKDACLKIVDLIRTDGANSSVPEVGMRRIPRLLPFNDPDSKLDIRPAIRRRPFGLGGLGRLAPSFDKVSDDFRLVHGPKACRSVSHEERMACFAIARSVRRGFVELNEGTTSGEICQKLNDKEVVKLAD